MMKDYINIKSVVFMIVVMLLLALPMIINSAMLSESDNVSESIEYVIGVSQPNLREPWQIIMNNEIKEEIGKHDNIRVVFTNALQDNNKQIEDIKQLLGYEIDLLIVSLNDSEELTPVISDVYKEIPVIVLDRGVIGYDYTLYIGPDNKSIGNKIGRTISKLSEYKRINIVELKGSDRSLPSIHRSEGLREIVDHDDNIDIYKSYVANWMKDEAEDIIKTVPIREADIDVIFAHNDAMAYGAIKALDERGIGDVSVIGVDGLRGSKSGIELVKQNKLYTTYTCPTGGTEAIQYAIDILNEQKGLPKKVILRSSMINKDTVESYLDLQTNMLDKTIAKPTMGFVQVGSESSWRIANSQSIKQAAQEVGIDLIFINVDENNTLGDTEKLKSQQQAIRDLIAQGVDVIGMSPIVESGWDDILKEAKKAGIPIILSDRMVDSDDSLWTCFLGSDFVEEGRRAARWLVTNQENKLTNIVELRGNDGSAPANGRSKGFREVLEDYNNYRIIHSESGDFKIDNGQNIVAKLLENKDMMIDVIYAHNDDMILGAIKAIEEKGLVPGKDITLISVDATKGAFKAMAAGKLNCAVECNPLLGPELMKLVMDISVGKSIPIKIITEEGVFTRENAKQYIDTRKY